MVTELHKIHGSDESTESKDDRRTPREIFDPLHARFDFTIDAAASKDNALLWEFWTKEVDGLKQSWANHRVWCNPPFSRAKLWVEKAFLETRANGGCPLVMMILPGNRTEQPFWQNIIERNRDGRGLDAVKTKFIAGRVAYGHPTKEEFNSPPFGSVLCLFRNKGTKIDFDPRTPF